MAAGESASQEEEMDDIEREEELGQNRQPFSYFSQGTEGLSMCKYEVSVVADPRPSGHLTRTSMCQWQNRQTQRRRTLRKSLHLEGFTATSETNWSLHQIPVWPQLPLTGFQHEQTHQEGNHTSSLQARGEAAAHDSDRLSAFRRSACFTEMHLTAVWDITKGDRVDSTAAESELIKNPQRGFILSFVCKYRKLWSFQPQHPE